MHNIEPHFRWRPLYIASEDERSPFYGREYSEFAFTETIYNHYIHPQWDSFGSNTMFLKVLYVDYDEGFTVIELLGEWNDCLYNDIMTLKRNVIDELIDEGINKFILIGENVLNFHASDDAYYEEWFEDIEDGWISLINLRDHVMDEFERENIDQYFVYGARLEEVKWRTQSPMHLFRNIDSLVNERLEPSLPPA